MESNVKFVTRADGRNARCAAALFKVSRAGAWWVSGGVNGIMKATCTHHAMKTASLRTQ